MLQLTDSRLATLSSLRKKAEELNLSSCSSDRTPTPLWVFLLLYTKANRECYMNYMAGAKALVAYLSPIEIPKYTTRFANCGPLGGYEMTELAKLFTDPAIPEAYKLEEVREVEEAILHCMYLQVIPKLIDIGAL